MLKHIRVGELVDRVRTYDRLVVWISPAFNAFMYTYIDDRYFNISVLSLAMFPLVFEFGGLESQACKINSNNRLSKSDGWCTTY